MMSVDMIHQYSVTTCEFCQYRWQAVIETNMIVWGNTWPNTIMMANRLECPNCGQYTKINDDEKLE